MPSVTQQLRKAIDKSGKGRNEIGRLAQIDKSRMSRFMAGGNLSLDQLDRLCKVLKLQLTPKGR